MRGRVLRRNERQKDRSAARKRESKGIIKIRSVIKIASSRHPLTCISEPKLIANLLVPDLQS